MVEDAIHDHMNVSLVALADEFLEIGKLFSWLLGVVAISVAIGDGKI